MTTRLTERYADAVTYAATAHAAQRRKGTAIPYVAHLLADRVQGRDAYAGAQALMERCDVGTTPRDRGYV